MVAGTNWSEILAGQRNGPDVAFTDRAHNHWIRRATQECCIGVASTPTQHRVDSTNRTLGTAFPDRSMPARPFTD